MATLPAPILQLLKMPSATQDVGNLLVDVSSVDWSGCLFHVWCNSINEGNDFFLTFKQNKHLASARFTLCSSLALVQHCQSATHGAGPAFLRTCRVLIAVAAAHHVCYISINEGDDLFLAFKRNKTLAMSINGGDEPFSFYMRNETLSVRACLS